MARRVVFGLILFAMGFYDSISLLVDEWEGRRCWDLGSPEYVCDGHGGEAIGAAAIEFLFVLPLGLIVLLAAIFAPRSAPAAA